MKQELLRFFFEVKIFEKTLYFYPFLGHGGTKRQRLTVTGMNDFQTGGAQAKPGDPEPFPEKTIVMGVPMGAVADQRMRDPIEMTADLMKAPGLWLHF